MKLKPVLKRLNINQSQLAEKLGVHMTTVSPWNKKGIPEKYHDQVNKLLENAPVGARPVKARRKRQQKDVVIQDLGELKPSSKKVLIMVLDSEDAQEYVKRFMSGEVG